MRRTPPSNEFQALEPAQYEVCHRNIAALPPLVDLLPRLLPRPILWIGPDPNFARNPLTSLVSPVGLEPTAPRLKVSCSTN
jgi:hypothetical protein